MYQPLLPSPPADCRLPVWSQPSGQPSGEGDPVHHHGAAVGNSPGQSQTQSWYRYMSLRPTTNCLILLYPSQMVHLPNQLPSHEYLKVRNEQCPRISVCVPLMRPSTAGDFVQQLDCSHACFLFREGCNDDFFLLSPTS